MKKNGSRFLARFLGVGVPIAALLSGCSVQPPVSGQFQPFTPVDLNAKIRDGQLRQKVENFLVVLDASSSTAQTYTGIGFPEAPNATKFNAEREFLGRMNQTLPAIKLSSGIRTFGYGSCTAWDPTLLNAPVAPYSRGGFQSTLDSMDCAFGHTPIDSGLEAATGDLQAAAGRTAVIVVSDGQTFTEDSTIEAAKRLQAQYGNRVCVHSVWIDNRFSDRGKDLMGALPTPGCGTATVLGSSLTPPEMAAFVEKVFLERGRATGCEDEDGDGVCDVADKCPRTPKGAKVNKDGCWVLTDLLFDFDKSTIKHVSYHILDDVVKVLKNPVNAHLSIQIHGHTDNKGTAAYNQSLSERRAAAVKAYLVKHGVKASRLTSKGFGFSEPAASNDTEQGRAMNRRVELHVIK